MRNAGAKENMMDFTQLTEHLNTELLDELDEVSQLREAYERHLTDGMHEALSFKLDQILPEVIDAHLQELYLTFYHLMCEDPNADDSAEALYGSMLAEGNMDAGLEMIDFLNETEDALSDILDEIIRKTIKDYKEAEFEEPEDDEDDIDDDDDDIDDDDIDDDDIDDDDDEETDA